MAPAADSGDVIHDIHTPEALRGFSEKCFDRHFRGRIARQKPDVAECLQVLYGAGAVAVVKTCDDEARTFLQKAPRGRQADAARAADNEATFVL